jgi:hypothetical protein
VKKNAASKCHADIVHYSAGNDLKVMVLFKIKIDCIENFFLEMDAAT